MTTKKEEVLEETGLEEVQTQEEEVTGTSLGSLAEKIKEEKKLRKKKKVKRMLLIGFFLLFAYLLYFLFKPFEESINYGICKTFLELQVFYPHTIYISEVQRLRSGTMRIWFSRIDPFGEYRMTPFECTFSPQPNPATGMPVITKMRMGKIEISPEIVKQYNHAIPWIVQNPPSLVLPGKLPDDIKLLQEDVNVFRKIIVK
ncbi:MAG: hypothetical protein OEY94_08670 [Alphaproteobacteria bacterium]|nr:hypothetical protein [Alphaproteobacteria bacterium]